ncbi:MAG: hypothetical protein CL677_08310 [Bdellovibrionaceae bacterium]|nr:hypothetical protein [Pseudobdellovibrionaceae bacterium]|tara:strand:- start:125067 stop:125351 length:285 start_codon:yes stop_codon:yes gene_type:complete
MELNKIKDSELDAFLERIYNDFVSELVKNLEISKAEAKKTSLEQIKYFFPDNKIPDTQFVYKLVDNAQNIGCLWWGIKPGENKKAWLYELRKRV